MYRQKTPDSKMNSQHGPTGGYFGTQNHQQQPQVSAFGGVSAHNIMFMGQNRPGFSSGVYPTYGQATTNMPLPYTVNRTMTPMSNKSNISSVSNDVHEVQRQRHKMQQHFGTKPTQLNPEAMIEAILGQQQSSHKSIVRTNSDDSKQSFPSYPISNQSVNGPSIGLMNSSFLPIPPTLLLRLKNKSTLPEEYIEFFKHCTMNTSSGQLPNTPIVYNLLVSSGLSRDMLGQIWSMVNRTVPGQLTTEEFFAAVALVALAQNGKPLSFTPLCDAKYLPVPRLNISSSTKVPNEPADKSTARAQSLQVSNKPRHRSSDDFGDFEFSATDKSAAISDKDKYSVLKELESCFEIEQKNATVKTLNENQTTITNLENTSLTDVISHNLGTPESGGSLSNSKEPSIRSLDLTSLKASEEEDKDIDGSATESACPTAFDSHPMNVFDKYAPMKETNCNGATEFADEHVSVWCKCLQSAHDLFDQGCHLLDQVSNSDVCRQVFFTEKGSNYLRSMAEVYKVVCRIRVSLKTTTFQTEKLVNLLTDVDGYWELMQNYSAGTDFLPQINLAAFNAELENRTDNSNTCGICLLNVDENDPKRLNYSGRFYHAQCSNLWVNCVDSLLPSLYVPSGLL